MPAISRFCQRTTHIARMARSYSRRRARSRVGAGHARDQPILPAHHPYRAHGALLQQATRGFPGTSGPCPRPAFITRRAHARYLHLAPPMCPVHRMEMEGLGIW